MPEITIAPSFAPFVGLFSSCFSKPSFQTFQHIMVGWILCIGRHTVTGILRASGAIGIKHHSSFHRFFRRAEWEPVKVSYYLTGFLLSWIPRDKPLMVAVDDTLGRHTGNKIRGAGMHHDPLLSTRTKAVLHFGHVWVVLSVVVVVPYFQKAFALPIMARLYRSEKVCTKEGKPFYKKTELAAQMILLLALQCPERTIYVLGDAGYANGSVVKTLPTNVHFIGRSRLDAALYAPPQQKAMGRPRIKGERVSSPWEHAAQTQGWQTLCASIYGRNVDVQVKVFDALWYKVSSGRCLRFVLVRGWPGHHEDDVLCSTDTSLSAIEIMRRFCLRWSLEVTFEEVKGKLGFEDPQNRTDKAVERTAPMALWAYTLTVMWYLHTHMSHKDYRLPQVPWYEKKVPAFSDMLAALRRELWSHRLLDPLSLTPKDQKSLDPLLDAMAYAA